MDNKQNSHYNKERKTKIVVLITFLTMIIELVIGYLSNSMALLADGWHMASHVGAIGASAIAYSLARKHSNNKSFKSGTDKILNLTGYTSAIALGFVAILMIYESAFRIFNPKIIDYLAAIPVACIGLVVNLASAKILHDKEHHNKSQDNHDHNIRSAYFHVLADALTSVFAIVALTVGYYLNIEWLDPLLGIIGGIVILKWSWNLSLSSGKSLLDYQEL